MGYGIATAGKILLAPTDLLIGTMVHKCTTGIPIESIAFTIVAPQRVQVPQADVKIAPSIPRSFNVNAMPSPNSSARVTDIEFPTVTKTSR